MLVDNLDLFAIDKKELTKADVEPFEINLNDTTPYAEKYLRYNRRMSKFIDDEVGALYEKGLIYDTKSNYAAKVVLAPKGDTWRMFLDYKGLNKRTVSDKFPLPNIEDLYASMEGCRYFSKIDLLSGYW